MLYSAYTELLPVANDRRHACVKGQPLLDLFNGDNNISPDDMLHLYTNLYVRCLHAVSNTPYCSSSMLYKFGCVKKHTLWSSKYESHFDLAYLPEPNNVGCEEHKYRTKRGQRGIFDLDAAEDYDNEKKLWNDIIVTNFTESLHDFSTSTIYDHVFDLNKSFINVDNRATLNLRESIRPNLLGTNDDWKSLYNKIVTLTESSDSPEFKSYCYRKMYPVFAQLSNSNYTLWDDMNWLRDFCPLVKQPTKTADVFITRDNLDDNIFYSNSFVVSEFSLNKKPMSIRSGYGAVKNGSPVKLLEVFKVFNHDTWNTVQPMAL